MKEKGQSEKVVKQKLTDVINQLINLSEGYLSEFEDDDPEASAKSTIDGIIDYINTEFMYIEKLYENKKY